MTEVNRRLDTLLAQAGHALDEGTGAVVPPLFTSTTFARDANYELRGGSMYARYGNPTLTLAERLMTELEGGSAALLFAAGMSAITCLLETLESGDRLVAPRVMYHGAQDWMRRLVDTRGIDLALFDASDPGGLERVLEEGGATIVWTESPVNPTWDVVDIRAAADAAHAVGASLVVDSTVAPPVTTRPLDLGADVVMHSATKYLNGHSDVLGGALVTRSVDARWEEVARIRTLTGAAMSPFVAWMLLRGVRTLALRFERSSVSALAIARHFEDHPALESVLYPGLASHPGHDVASRQMTRGFGGMLSLLVRGGTDRARGVATRTRVFIPATSLGGVESLIEHRITVEGPHSTVPGNLLRLSIGIEDVDDLIADLEQALGERT